MTMNTFGINNLPDMTDAYKQVQEKAKDYDGDCLLYTSDAADE